MKQKNDDKKIAFTRSQLSKLSGISKYSIKFWTNCGLLSYTTDKNNNYKYYGLEKLPDLAKANFFSKIGVPIANQKTLRSCDRKRMLEIYKEQIVSVDNQIAKLYEGKASLLQMINQIEYLNAKENLGYYEEEPDFNFLVKVDSANDYLMNALFKGDASNNTYVKLDKFGNISKVTYTTGLKENSTNLPVLWSKPTDKYFLCRIVKKEGEDKPEISKEELIAEVNKMGYEIECVIYKHLLSVEESNITDNYFVVYVQCKQKEQ